MSDLRKLFLIAEADQPRPGMKITKLSGPPVAPPFDAYETIGRVQLLVHELDRVIESGTPWEVSNTCEEIEALVREIRDHHGKR